VAGRWWSEAFGDQWTFISEIMLKDKGNNLEPEDGIWLKQG
jgi:hypothetical protein